MKGGGLFAPISREGALVLNNLLLSTAAATVLLGTLYPLFLDAFSGAKVSVGPPFFNATFLPLAIPLVVALAVGPFLPWKRADLNGVFARLKFALIFVLFVLGITWWLVDEGPILAFVGMSLFAWLTAAVFIEWAGRIKLFKVAVSESMRRAKNLPRSAYGMSIAHLGVAMIILGITASEAWQSERLDVMKTGETATVGGYEFTFKGAEKAVGPNYDILRGKFVASKNGHDIVTLQPEQRVYQNPPMETTEAAIWPMLSADLYVVIGEEDGQGGYATRIYHKPFVSWIWGGSIVMFIGGLFSLSDRRFRIGAARGAKKPIAGVGAAG